MKVKWFEYHCLESDKSNDAKLWHYSHQKIEILKIIERGIGKNKKERINNGCFRLFRVKFQDNFIADVFEDEILNSQSEFERPTPPGEIR